VIGAVKIPRLNEKDSGIFYLFLKKYFLSENELALTRAFSLKVRFSRALGVLNDIFCCFLKKKVKTGKENLPENKHLEYFGGR
jgi:hypothetical protein